METILKEIADAIIDLPKQDTRVWYFSFDEKDGRVETLLANYVGARFKFEVIGDMFNRKKPPIEEYFVRNDHHSEIFTVKKIYKTREEALQDIGGYILGTFTPLVVVDNRAKTDSDPGAA